VQILKAVTVEDLELSNALNSLGNLLRNASDFEQALDCYDQSLAIRIELGDQLKIANTKNNIGAVLSAMEELDRAMAFTAEALRIKTERLGCDSVETGRALVNVRCFNYGSSSVPNCRCFTCSILCLLSPTMITLSFQMGQLYVDQKLYNNAEKYCERGLRIFQINVEVNQLDIAMCMHKLGVIKEALLDDESALEFYLQSIYIFKNNGGFKKNVTMACSLHNAVSVYLRQNIFTTALEYMTEAFHTKTASLGARHFETAASQHCLGIIYKYTWNWKTRKPFFVI
jgi:tetratricopeptide (TPR) repeat protein